jgi:hypothetical protein
VAPPAHPARVGLLAEGSGAGFPLAVNLRSFGRCPCSAILPSPCLLTLGDVYRGKLRMMLVESHGAAMDLCALYLTYNRSGIMVMSLAYASQPPYSSVNSIT